MGCADTYSQPEAPDPVLSEELVVQLASRYLPAGTPVSRVCAVDESGGEARAYLLDADVVVKTQRPHRLRPRTSLRKEARLLEALSGPLAGRIPVVFGYDEVDTDVGMVEFIVMSRVTGQAVRHAEIDEAARSGLLGEVAAVLRAVHALDHDELGLDGLLPRDADGLALRRRLELGFADIVDALQENPGVWTLPGFPTEVAARAVAVLPGASQKAVVLHSNPGPTHVFVDDDGTFTGIIDFGDAYCSHPALDLRSWPDPDDRVMLYEAYCDGEPSSAEFDAVWTVAMLYADMAAVASRPHLAARAGEDLLSRLAQL